MAKLIHSSFLQKPYFIKYKINFLCHFFISVLKRVKYKTQHYENSLKSIPFSRKKTINNFSMRKIKKKRKEREKNRRFFFKRFKKLKKIKFGSLKYLPRKNFMNRIKFHKRIINQKKIKNIVWSTFNIFPINWFKSWQKRKIKYYIFLFIRNFAGGQRRYRRKAFFLSPAAKRAANILLMRRRDLEKSILGKHYKSHTKSKSQLKYRRFRSTLAPMYKSRLKLKRKIQRKKIPYFKRKYIRTNNRNRKLTLQAYSKKYDESYMYKKFYRLFAGILYKKKKKFLTRKQRKTQEKKKKFLHITEYSFRRIQITNSSYNLIDYELLWNSYNTDFVAYDITSKIYKYFTLFNRSSNIPFYNLNLYKYYNILKKNIYQYIYKFFIKNNSMNNYIFLINNMNIFKLNQMRFKLLFKKLKSFSSKKTFNLSSTLFFKIKQINNKLYKKPSSNISEMFTDDNLKLSLLYMYVNYHKKFNKLVSKHRSYLQLQWNLMVLYSYLQHHKFFYTATLTLKSFSKKYKKKLKFNFLNHLKSFKKKSIFLNSEVKSFSQWNFIPYYYSNTFNKLFSNSYSLLDSILNKLKYDYNQKRIRFWRNYRTQFKNYYFFNSARKHYLKRRRFYQTTKYYKYKYTRIIYDESKMYSRYMRKRNRRLFRLYRGIYKVMNKNYKSLENKYIIKKKKINDFNYKRRNYLNRLNRFNNHPNNFRNNYNNSNYNRNNYNNNNYNRNNYNNNNRNNYNRNNYNSNNYNRNKNNHTILYNKTSSNKNNSYWNKTSNWNKTPGWNKTSNWNNSSNKNYNFNNNSHLSKNSRKIHYNIPKLFSQNLYLSIKYVYGERRKYLPQEKKRRGFLRYWGIQRKKFFIRLVKKYKSLKNLYKAGYIDSYDFKMFSIYKNFSRLKTRSRIRKHENYKNHINNEIHKLNNNNMKFKIKNIDLANNLVKLPNYHFHFFQVKKNTNFNLIGKYIQLFAWKNPHISSAAKLSLKEDADMPKVRRFNRDKTTINLYSIHGKCSKKMSIIVYLSYFFSYDKLGGINEILNLYNRFNNKEKNLFLNKVNRLINNSIVSINYILQCVHYYESYLSYSYENNEMFEIRKIRFFMDYEPSFNKHIKFTSEFINKILRSLKYSLLTVNNKRSNSWHEDYNSEEENILNYEPYIRHEDYIEKFMVSPHSRTPHVKFNVAETIFYSEFNYIKLTKQQLIKNIYIIINSTQTFSSFFPPVTVPHNKLSNDKYINYKNYQIKF